MHILKTLSSSKPHNVILGSLEWKLTSGLEEFENDMNFDEYSSPTPSYKRRRLRANPHFKLEDVAKTDNGETYHEAVADVDNGKDEQACEIEGKISESYAISTTDNNTYTVDTLNSPEVREGKPEHDTELSAQLEHDTALSAQPEQDTE